MKEERKRGETADSLLNTCPIKLAGGTIGACDMTQMGHHNWLQEENNAEHIASISKIHADIGRFLDESAAKVGAFPCSSC